MDPNIEQSIVDRLKQTNNVLVTVKNNPTVDQLAACIGLTLFLNKMGKHATAVFSGEVPSTLEFLKPELTIEKDTNSLRDFIVSLDKSKADKLRYKVEDKIVKIFITPYRTSLSESDLEFSQGDFNVDVVVALGVRVREELDQAIMAYGRILHDATIISINNSKPADLGALNWNDAKASSLSEMTVGMLDILKPNSLDAQIATAFLTGIVSETERFSNNKTTPITMSLSAKLMAAGANQQLVSSKLQQPAPEVVASEVTAQDTDKPQEDQKEVPKPDGELEINHPKKHEIDMELPSVVEEKPEDDTGIQIDDDGNLKTGLQDDESKKDNKEADDTKPAGRLTLEPPTLGGTLTANTEANKLDPSIDPLSGDSPHGKIIERDESNKVESDLTPGDIAGVSTKLSGVNTESGGSVASDQTLTSIEEQVNSTHISENAKAPKLSPLSVTTPAEDALPSQEATTVPNATSAGLDSLLKSNSSMDEEVNSAQPPTLQPPAEQPLPTQASEATGQLSELQPPLQPPLQPTSPTDFLNTVASPDTPTEPVVEAEQPAEEGAPPDVEAMRKAVEEASYGAAGAPLDPIQSLNAQILGEDLNAPAPVLPGMPVDSSDTPLAAPVSDPSSPPPVPPPMMPPAFTQNQDSLE